MSAPVRAHAVVDVVGRGIYTVTVWGEPPHAQTRVYTIGAVSDNTAAMQGIRYFVDDMENLPVRLRKD